MRHLDYKWRLLAFLFVAFFIELGSRQLYSAALPQIRLEFLKYGVTDAQLGVVVTVFGAVFGLALMASGLAADLLGRKRVLVVGTLLFSVGILGSGFAKGIGGMMLFYGVINALGQCCIAPASYALISKYHVDTRSTAMAALHGALWLNLFALASCILTAKAIDKFGAKRPRIRLEVSVLGFLLCIAPVVWVAKAGSFGTCCVALSALGLTVGVYDAAHYPAMFDCIAPRYRSAATGITGCMAFLMGSLAPVVLGWMSDHLSMRAGLASLGAFYLVGALVLLPAMIWFFKRDRVEG